MYYYAITDVYNGVVLLILKNSKSPTNKQILFHLNRLAPDLFTTIKDVTEGINVQRVQMVEV